MELLDAPFERAFDALTEIDGVVVVHWPEDAARAVELARVGTPRLFLVAAEADPPDVSDELCAWVRVPAYERDVQARIVELRSRASVARPILGDHGLLWRGTEWTALSPIEARLTAAFIARPGRVLSRARLEKTGWPDGSPNERSIDARIKALRRRVAPLGLRIHTVRGQGYIAEIQPVSPRD
ncbi:MAG TPA: winged helix-turn-helix domain-containing protein [Acidimicrobiia bacterium]|nr:winged helix-turn-helix domain-containing protein [Acidimicrobiia bacterium]